MCSWGADGRAIIESGLVMVYVHVGTYITLVCMVSLLHVFQDASRYASCTGKISSSSSTVNKALSPVCEGVY